MYLLRLHLAYLVSTIALGLATAGAALSRVAMRIEGDS